VNKVSIPKFFVKVALDVKNKRAIGFILPHVKIENPLESYAVSVDSAERVLGYDLFSTLNDELENSVESKQEYKVWLPESQKNDVRAIDLAELPEKAINTTRVKGVVNDDRKHMVCGNVVSTKKHKKGHVFIDLDKKFPHQVFSVSIFQSSIKNFDYEPEVYLLNKQVCFSGKIGEYNDTPNMIIEHSKQIELLEHQGQ
jgi:endonuclease G